jgi:adhesin/invasin
MHKGRILRTGICLVLLILPVQSPPSSAVSSTPTATCVSSTCTVTFTYTGDYYSWTVPAGVSNINFDVNGAAGGNGTNPACSGSGFSTGGKGGRVQGSLTVTQGNILYFYVGGSGASAQLAGGGGWNGGGATNATGTPCYPGAGGGASDIRTSLGTLSTRLVVAGGGGGAGGYTSGGNGGGGGGTTAIDGSGPSWPAGAGKAGTQIAGGNKGNVCGSAVNGSLGNGGSGYGCSHGGGGGGGGYYGGGGGDIEGAGGGSSFTHATLVTGTPTHTQNTRVGNGLITITYSDLKTATTTTLSLAGNVTSVEKRKAIDLTATVTVAGKVTFFSNGKRIAGCINKVAASTTAVCSVKATVMGQAIYTASFTPTSSSYLASTSSPLTVTVVRRTGTR